MSRRSSLASLLLERLGEEEEERKVPVPSMSMPFRVLGDEELPAWLGLPWSPKSWPPSSLSQVFSSEEALYITMCHYVDLIFTQPNSLRGTAQSHKSCSK